MADDKRRGIEIDYKNELDELQEKYGGTDFMYGMTLMTYPTYISSSRNMMFTSHLRQFVNLMHPHIPKVFTSYENIVGKYSTGYKTSNSDYEVVAIIPKFTNGKEAHLYTMVVYDRTRDYYDIIQKKVNENLTEKFGFAYDTRNLDSKEEGDSIEKDEVIYKSTSYDEDMHYRYGRNATFLYLLKNDTIEDAVEVSQTFSSDMTSLEVETIKITLNDNDILCNIYGDKDNYKCIPDICDTVKDKILCAKRRIHNNQLLFDLKESNMRKINYMSDVLHYSEGIVTDINIFSNKELDEIPDVSFNTQLKDYLRQQNEYYEKIRKVCEEIKESGSGHSNEINFFYQKAKEITDPNYKWREEDNSIFSNMIIEITVERRVGLYIGQKITGRYGNKGVVSRIVPDDEMPILENGKRVDVIYNTLGVINRTTSFPLFEQSINFICNRTIDKMKEMTDLNEKVDLSIKMMNYFNEEYASAYKKYCNTLSKKELAEVIDDLITDGFFNHIPITESEAIYDRICRVYDENEWIKPYKVYVNRFGRRIQIMRDLIVGEMYFIKLKQSSKKGSSMRATGSINSKGVPAKSNAAKNHQELYPRTPVRIGDQENMNIAISVDTDTLAEFHNYYRSSVLGRRSFGEAIASSTDTLEDFDIKIEHTNRNVEIQRALFKTLGLNIAFEDEIMNIDCGAENQMSVYNIEDTLNYDDSEIFIGRYGDYKKKMKIKEIEKENCYIAKSDEDYQKFIDEKLAEEEIYTVTIR